MSASRCRHHARREKSSIAKELEIARTTSTLLSLEFFVLGKVSHYLILEVLKQPTEKPLWGETEAIHQQLVAAGRCGPSTLALSSCKATALIKILMAIL